MAVNKKLHKLWPPVSDHHKAPPKETKKILFSLNLPCDVLLLASSDRDLQHALRRFAAECGESQQLQVWGQGSLLENSGMLPAPSEGVPGGLFTWVNEKMEHEMDQRVRLVSTVLQTLYRIVVGKTELSLNVKLLILACLLFCNAKRLLKGSVCWI